MVHDGYKLELLPRSFKYSGGKNSGHMKLISGSFSSDVSQTPMNGFEAGYKKHKNTRIFEYKINTQFILRDTFENRQNMPVNLVPYRENCDKIMKNFK